MVTEREGVAPRVRIALAWLLSAMIIGVYLWLPSGNRTHSTERAEVETADALERLDIVDVSPAAPYPGGLMIVSYAGAEKEFVERVFIGKEEIPVVSRRSGSIVTRIPT